MTPQEAAELSRRAWELYHPCDCGIHVCGDKDGAAATVANITARDETEARRIFYACKAEAGEEDGDLVVDLNINRDNQHVEDFYIRRQMLDRCLAAGRAALR